VGEFDLIKHYFVQGANSIGPINREPITLGIGDDCALLAPLIDEQWAVSTDMFIEGRHFFAGTAAYDIGYKALAVNLSDLAAMGAKPIAFTLALALPDNNPLFLQEFSRGLFALASQHNCHLIGGDTTRGPLNICITVFGSIANDQALRRDRAQVGDDVWVSGSLGAAAWAVREQTARLASLEALSSTLQNGLLEAAQNKLLRPTPRVALGLALRGVAHSALDLSDGLSGDLAHIAQSSMVAIEINCACLPISPEIAHLLPDQQLQLACVGGDDYELAFTAPRSARATIEKLSQSLDTSLSRIGNVVSQNKNNGAVRFLDAARKPLAAEIVAQWHSFQHFS
jgi:thiamine-monophosphate kinase